MKKRIAPLLLALCQLALCGLAGCSPEPAPDLRGMVKVMLVETEAVQADAAEQFLPRGGDARFCLTIADGYTFAGTDYADSSYEERADGSILLTLHRVLYSTEVTPAVSGHEVRIAYDANGGRFASGEEEPRICAYDTTFHPQPNTANVLCLEERPGYTPIGWNTAADGSGQHVGFGSRVCALPGEPLHLYAQWLAWAPAEEFIVEPASGGCRIRLYRGNADPLVIPAHIGGDPVVEIASGALIGKDAQTVVLPPTLRSVAGGAFSGCGLRELYFFDNIDSIADDSFVSCAHFSTVHINAAEPPRYAGASKNNYYADKVALLAEESDRPRLVFMAGSSIWYNLKGDAVRDAVQDRYRIVDLGLNGFFCATAQFEIMKAYLRPGDVVVHTPEPCSTYQLMEKTEMTDPLFASLELNYDLFALVDVRRVPGVFSAFTAYNAARRPLIERDYADTTSRCYIDEYGGYAPDLPMHGVDENLADPADICPELLTNVNLGRLNDYYREICAITGNRVLVSFSAVNASGLPEDCTEQVWEAYELRLREGADASAAAVFGDIAENVWPGRYFYASNFHLSTEGAERWSEMFAGRLAEQLRAEGLL